MGSIFWIQSKDYSSWCKDSWSSAHLQEQNYAKNIAVYASRRSEKRKKKFQKCNGTGRDRNGLNVHHMEVDNGGLVAMLLEKYIYHIGLHILRLRICTKLLGSPFSLCLQGRVGLVQVTEDGSKLKRPWMTVVGVTICRREYGYHRSVM